MTRKTPVHLQRDHPSRAPTVERDPGGDAQAIDDLATRVNLLGGYRGDPERFHAEKSDIAVRLRRLAKALRGAGGGPAETTTWYGRGHARG